MVVSLGQVWGGFWTLPASPTSNITPSICVTWALGCLRDVCPAWLGDIRELFLKTLDLGLSPLITHQPLFSDTRTANRCSPPTSPHGNLSQWPQVSPTFPPLALPDPAPVTLGSLHQSCFAISCGIGSGLWRDENSRQQNLLWMSWLPWKGADASYFYVAFSWLLHPISVCCQLPLHICSSGVEKGAMCLRWHCLSFCVVILKELSLIVVS